MNNRLIKATFLSTLLIFVNGCDADEKSTTKTKVVSETTKDNSDKLSEPMTTYQSTSKDFKRTNSLTFSQSKKFLKQIYGDHQVTFYCGCEYKYDKNGDEDINAKKCGYKPRNPLNKEGETNPRTTRIEWEHMFPAENFGRHLPCWKEGGRKGCAKDDKFNEMESDMRNLVPAIGELNGDRSNLRYGANKPKIGQYGECNFQVDFDADRAYVRDEVKGDIARAYFHMSKQYDIQLSDQEKKMMKAWDKLDPIDEWEKKKNERIDSILKSKKAKK